MDIYIPPQQAAEVSVDPIDMLSLPPGIIDRTTQKEGRPTSGEYGQPQGVPELTVTESESTGTRASRLQGEDSPDRGGAVPLDPSDEPVLIGGNLQKKGKRFHGWHQRYFEVQGRHLYYYKTSQKRHFLGEIDLNICFFCGPTSAATFGHPFEIRSLQRSHIFAARSYEEMKKWTEVIQANMSTTEKEAKQAKKGRVKRWESIKSTFSVQPRQVPDASLRSTAGKKKQKKKAQQEERHKSFVNKLKLWRARETAMERSQSRSRSPSPAVTPSAAFSFHDDELEPPPNKRPMSMFSDEMSPATLDVISEFPPSPRSLPSTPLAKKRDVEEVTTPSVSPLHIAQQAPSPKQPKEKSPPPVTTKVVKPDLPEFLQRRFAFDDIRDLLDSAPEWKKDYSYDELSPEETSWLQKPTGVEQLREFLLVCA